MSFNMVLTWGPSCDFIFLTWSTQTPTTFWLGVTATFLISFLSTAYGPLCKYHIQQVYKNKVVLTVGYLGEYLLKLIVMMLMMTMNAWVCLAIALGISLGHLLFQFYGSRLRKWLYTSP